MSERVFVESCRVCSHSQRASIEEAIIRGASPENISKSYSAGFPKEPLSQHSVYRHRRFHCAPEWLAKARAASIAGLKHVDLDALRTTERANLLRLLVVYRSQVDQLVEMAVNQKDLRCAAVLISRRTKLLEVLGHVLGELGPVGNVSTVNNYLISPSYIALRAGIIRALSGPEFKAARAAVVKEMQALENAPEPVDVTDVESKEISGAGSALPFVSAQAATDGTPARRPAVVSVPAVIDLATYSNSQTNDR
ncbi:MAG: hypothetical protein WA993_17545 [Candidatus Binatus sp.]|jgi:hypothetical protein|uniref:hypothetical protein n=1 Tax=Candidatus Binatus sp. TaxID=2811406 RepID=UPI003C9459C8